MAVPTHSPATGEYKRVQALTHHSNRFHPRCISATSDAKEAVHAPTRRVGIGDEPVIQGVFPKVLNPGLKKKTIRSSHSTKAQITPGKVISTPDGPSSHMALLKEIQASSRKFMISHPPPLCPIREVAPRGLEQLQVLYDSMLLTAAQRHRGGFSLMMLFLNRAGQISVS